MIDKVDRPKAHEPWSIKATTQSQDRGKEEHQPSPDDEYSSPGEDADPWEKFHSPQEVRKVLNIKREEVRHLWFRKASLQRQTAIVECDMELNDGKLYRAAQFLLARMEDYFQFKGYAVGQEVAVTTVVHEPIVEVSVAVPSGQRAPKRKPTQATTPETVPSARWWQLFDPNTGRLHRIGLGLYTAVVAVAITIILALL